MKTVVYIDILLSVNLILTYLLLRCTAMFAKQQMSRFRLCISSVVGAFYSFIILAPDVGIIWSLLLKSCMCITLVCIAFALRKIRDILLCSFLFFVVSSAFAGIMFLIQSFFSAQWLIIHNGCVYFGFSLTQIVFLSIICYVIFMLIAKFLNRNKGRIICEVEFEINGICKKANALVDSGNCLYDPIGNKPVSVVGFSTICDMIPLELVDYFHGNFSVIDQAMSNWLNRLLTIPAHTTIEEGLMPALRVDRLMIHLDNRTIVIDNCIFAVCNKQLKIEEEILLHPDLAGVQNNQVMKGNYHVKFNSRSSL